MTKTIFVLNGPNLNMIGTRQPEIYGHDTIADVEARCHATAPEGFAVQFRQTNYEGELVTWIQEARAEAAGIIINAAAYSHTSIAVMDALMSFDGPVIEVHFSQVHKREDFRHHSYVSHRADGFVAGFGVDGYEAAVWHICRLIG